MRFVRTILAFAIAISLAMLPVGVSASSLAMSSDDMHATMQMGGDAEMSLCYWRLSVDESNYRPRL